MIDSKVEIITPSMAKEYLEKNVKNRPINLKTVNKYAEDMASGNWELTHQGIAFNENGELIDGQHRLQAVIKSEASVEMMVARGISNQTVNIDRPKARSLYDNMHMGFLDIDSKMINPNILSMCKVVIHPLNKGNISDMKLIEFIEKYASDIKELQKTILPTNRIRYLTVAAVEASIFMAYKNGVDIKQLERFYQVLKTGMSVTEKEKPIIALRNVLLRNEIPGFRKNAAIVLRTQFAIKQYASGSCSSRNKEPIELIYKFEV